MNKKQAGSVLSLCMALIGLVLICLGAYLLKAQNDRTEELEQTQKVSREDHYRDQGLSPGEKLDSVPDDITDTQVIFSDRVLQRYNRDETGIGRTLSLLKAFGRELKEKNPSERAYISVMPLRIGFESGFSEDKEYLNLVTQERERLDALENRILEGVSSDITPVYVNRALERHQEEYIFYRNTDAWTSLGAYYAAQEFAEAAGLEPFSIDDFWEYGEIQSENDRRYYYLYEGYDPFMYITKEDGTQIREPLVSAQRSDGRVIIGTQHAYSILKGLAENGKNLMVIDVGNGNLIVPWLVTEYEKILYVDLPYFDPEKMDLWKLMEEHDICDVYLVLGAGERSWVTAKWEQIMETAKSSETGD